MYNLTKALKDEGVPLHYVGSQTHIDLEYYTDFDGYIDSLKEYSQNFVQDLDVEWHFTEMTVAAVDEDGDEGDEPSFMTLEAQEIQAILYTGLMQACIDLGPSICTAFQVNCLCGIFPNIESPNLQMTFPLSDVGYRRCIPQFRSHQSFPL